MVANLKKMSAIGAESRKTRPPGVGIVLTGAKKCLVLVLGGLGGLGGQKNELSQSRESNPGIVDGND